MFDSEDAAIEMAGELGSEWRDLGDPQTVSDGARGKLVRRLSPSPPGDPPLALDIIYFPYSPALMEIRLSFPQDNGTCPSERTRRVLAQVLTDWTNHPTAREPEQTDFLYKLLGFSWQQGTRISNGLIGDVKFVFVKSSSYCTAEISRLEPNAAI